ncbi:cysteine--tRNA ligase [Methylobacterium haplocladii]|uniref:Cysteine--tRNA ligase n=1 Tax=Methylobacterium haplocladii TaxID=1176176 RepID=A0A512ILF8_9HYPH|nr:cysteine--tRNA ligase [Methylobacterium haplocladii]GEO98482.1 cysteine--tRNA ligase [Methylobacterium haplocladii]GJD82788.1 Cysteine--tRNA ligase [Methylobacterium haplocladii]GLS61124.1 cysteine--tRNA ligase [Methylobacterium haplocladii]
MAPMLRLYNTLTREKAPFAPIDPTNVRVYACGPTVYDAAHIGNARPIIVFDLLFRLLRHLYGPAHVTYARNVTDVDDKINARAALRGITIRELTDETLKAFHADVRDLGVLMPDDVNVPGARARFIEPRATDHIVEMVTLIEGLVAAGHAYVAQDHVLFDVPSMPDYGGLSRRPLDEMEAGARVEVAPYKRSPLDFVLWKPSKPGEPSWPSPADIAAPGRPGWHIECSAMSWKHLGQTFDIHAGGIDLIFPHHENEVAQSRCCFGTAVMANVWLHNGFLQVEGEKMSKSLGNFITIREVLADWPGEVVRLAMLKTHYRQPIDWTLRGLEEASRTLDRWYGAVGDASPAQHMPPAVLEPLLDDLNTAAALAELHRLDDPATLKAGASLLGLLGQTQSGRAQASVQAAGIDVGKVEALIEERRAARAAKDWAASDRVRDALLAMGVAVKDNKDGTTTWSVVT